MLLSVNRLARVRCLVSGSLGLGALFLLGACGDDGAAGVGEGEATSSETGEADSGDDGTETETETQSETQSETEATSGDGDGDGDGVVPDPCTAPTAHAPLDAAALAGLQEALDAALDASPVSGYLQSVHVVDHETGQVLYSRNEQRAQKPASNTKLVTTAAAMHQLGKGHRTAMRVFATAVPDAGGVINGELHLVGRHDFSADDEFFADVSFPYLQLAQDLADVGVTGVTGATFVRGEFLVDGFSLGTYNAGVHRGFAADEWDAALAAVGLSVSSPVLSADFSAPAGAVELAAWESPPLEVTGVPINVQSHNEFADILARHLGFETQGSSDFIAGGAEMLATLEELGVDSSEFSFNDGSGLSHNNRISALGLTTLMRSMLESGLAEPWVRTFSIAGVRGTLGGRMTGADTAGRFYGKSGTLFDTITTSGVLFHAHDHRRYLVSVLMNNQAVDIDRAAARAVQDQVVGIVGQDWRGVQPLAAPELELALGRGTGIAELRWAPVLGADSYVVYLSDDGWTWRRARSCQVDDTTFVAGELAPNAPSYVRVASWSVAGGEGPSSDVRAVHASDAGTRVLLVDANERWSAEPNAENTRGLSNDFLVHHGEAMPAELAFDSVSSTTLVGGGIELDAYAAIVWALGEQSTTHETFAPEAQALIRTYLSEGGALLASGSEIGWDLVAQGDDEDREFFADVFHANYLGDDAGTFVVKGAGAAAGSLPTRLSFFTPGQLVADFPDQLSAMSDAQPLLTYVASSAATAAVTYDGDHRSALVGFPLECIDNASDRAALLGELFARLGVLP